MKEIIERLGTKALIIASFIFIGVIVIVIAASLAYNKLFYKKSYSEIESIMKNAAINYYKDNKGHYPKNNGETTTIKTNKLTSDKYMNPISEYLKNDKIKCEGTVNITKLNKKYRYTPILDCKEYYQTELLVTKIKSNSKIVTSGEGLYNMNDELVYRGENPNNYVKFANYEWRIIKIKNDQLVLIFNDDTNDNEDQVWDDRYNKEENEDVGINDYTVSRILEYNKKLYKSNKMFNQDDKLLLSNFDLYIGKRKKDETNKNGEIEKSRILENQYIGLLPAYDYLNASLDVNCLTTSESACKNYNYLLSYKQSWWLLTANAANTYEVYKTSRYSNLKTMAARERAQIRPVITIVKDAIYVNGNGTQTHPYEFK